MAFRTRTGRIVAIGHGSLRAAQVLWGLSSALLLVPLAVTALSIVQMARPETQSTLEQPLASLESSSVLALATLVMTRAFAVTCGLGAFVAPRGRMRDQMAAALRSQTARSAVLSMLAALALLVVSRLPSGTGGGIAFLALTVLLVTLDVLVHRGLRSLITRNRKVPFFEGLTEQQKRAAERPWPVRERPTFPGPKAIVSHADAQKYARRAKDIAILHEWVGAGLVIVFSAFVGTAILAMLESKEPAGQLPMLLVLGFVALGLWLQRRAQSYLRLAESFSERRRRLRPRTLSARGRAIRRRL